MSFLAILFWLLLILSAIGVFIPTQYPKVNSVSGLILFALLGLRVFPLVLN